MMKLNKGSISNNTAVQPDFGTLQGGTDLFTLGSGRYFIVDIQAMVNAPSADDMIGNCVLVIDSVLENSTPVNTFTLKDYSGNIAIAIVSNGVLSQDWRIVGSTPSEDDPDVIKVRSSAFIALSFDTIPVSDDENNPNFIQGLSFFGTDNGDFLLNPVDGSIQNNTGRALDKMIGGISFHPEKTAGGGTEVLYLWSERSVDGITWFPTQGSLRVFEVPTDGESFKTSISAITNFLPGEYVRFKMYSDDNNLQLTSTSTVAEGATIVGGSIAWELQESLIGEIEFEMPEPVSSLPAGTIILNSKNFTGDVGEDWRRLDTDVVVTQAEGPIVYDLYTSNESVGMTLEFDGTLPLAGSYTDHPMVFKMGSYYVSKSGSDSNFRITDETLSQYSTFADNYNAMWGPIGNGLLRTRSQVFEGCEYLSFDLDLTTPTEVASTRTSEFHISNYINQVFPNQGSFKFPWEYSLIKNGVVLLWNKLDATETKNFAVARTDDVANNGAISTIYSTFDLTQVVDEVTFPDFFNREMFYGITSNHDIVFWNNWDAVVYVVNDVFNNNPTNPTFRQITLLKQTSFRCALSYSPDGKTYMLLNDGLTGYSVLDLDNEQVVATGTGTISHYATNGQGQSVSLGNVSVLPSYDSSNNSDYYKYDDGDWFSIATDIGGSGSKTTVPATTYEERLISRSIAYQQIGETGEILLKSTSNQMYRYRFTGVVRDYVVIPAQPTNDPSLAYFIKVE